MAKISDRVPNERLGISRLSYVFPKIYQEPLNLPIRPHLKISGIKNLV